TDDVTGAPALTTSAVVSSGVGTYTINIAAGTLASSNYIFAFENGTLTIDAAPLTITANNFIRRVNASDPAFTVNYSGFVSTDDASALGGALSFTTTSSAGSGTGAYTITPSGLTSSNYAITFVPGTLTIADNIALTITANAASRLYGASNPAFTASYSGFVGNDGDSHVTGLQFSTTATQSSGVGAYTITPYNATAEGYVISFVPATLTINRAPLTIALPNQSRSYGDANNFTVNYNGLVNDDTSAVVSGLFFNTTATPSSNVGNYAVIGTGASAANYDISYTGGTLSVTPAPLVVSFNPVSRLYGDADPTFTYSISGLKNEDPSSLVSVQSIGSLASPEAGIGAYGIVGFPFVSSSNYTVNPQANGTLTITPRPLTITANSFSRVYGDANPAFTATFSGLASFDTPAAFGNLGLTTQATQSSGVGDWGITFGALSNPNYTITREFGTLTITPAPLTFQPLIELSRVYGRANPAPPPPEVGGLKNSDTVDNLGITFGTPALNAGVGTYAYTLTTNNPNYTLSGATGEFRVTPAPLTVTIGTNGRIYGDANPTGYDLAVTGLVFGQDAASAVGVSNPTERLTPVGTYAVAPVLNDTNYFIESFTGGAFHISPRVLTFTAANLYKIYGDANPALSGTFTGFADGDLQADVVGVHGFSTDVNQATSVGTYEIRPAAQLLSSNYLLSTVNGEFRVIPALLSITIADAIRFPGGPNPVFTASAVQGLKNQDTLASLGVVFSTTATAQSDAGLYPITGQITSPNYTTTFSPGELTVRRFEDNIDLTRQLDPSRLTKINDGSTPIFKDNKTTDETVEVEKPVDLTLATRTDVDYSTASLGKADFANYLAGFASEMDAVKANLADGYGDFLAGKGKSDSAYESMSAAARQLLADWMGGTLSTDALRNLIASGDADASIAFGFILPTLVNMTRAKDVADMTPMDREVLGRLADLTEQRKNATIALAQQKYEAMLEANAKRAELNGLANLFVGPGDFQAIVESATQEAIGTYIGSTIGAAAGGSATAALLALPGVAAAIFPHAGTIVGSTFV
ncbi:MAG TPA: MBG domain-containing protein, partial [Rariglobus sp.]